MFSSDYVRNMTGNCTFFQVGFTQNIKEDCTLFQVELGTVLLKIGHIFQFRSVKVSQIYSSSCVQI